jgi:hypothetical protein
MAKAWRWMKEHDGTYKLVDHAARNRCTVWPNGTWHTWNERGVGGENDTAPNIQVAKHESMAAVIRQGWAKLVTDHRP